MADSRNELKRIILADGSSVRPGDIEWEAKREIAEEQREAAIEAAKAKIIKRRTARKHFFVELGFGLGIGLCLGFLAGIPVGFIFTLLHR